MTDAPDKQSPNWRSPLAVAAAVTAWVGLLSVGLPPNLAGTAVGLSFFAATYWLVLRGSVGAIGNSGLALGGVLEPAPLEPARIAKASLGAAGWALLVAAVVFPVYAWGHHVFFATRTAFAFSLGDNPGELLPHHLLAVALPEEMFYRGYLQSALDRVWPPRVRVLGASVGLGLLVSSLIFALGHVVTTPHWARLSVFFPSLVFGWLRARTGGVGAAVLFHAACNVLSAGLAGGSD